MQRQSRSHRRWSGIAAGLALLATPLLQMAARADWPMYRGPAGNGVSTGRIRTNWDVTPPKLLWRTPLTNGLSSVTISGGRAFTQVRRGSALGGTEHCVALSITNGTILWSAQVGTARYPDGGVGGDDGPRSTPVVRGDQVFVLGSYLDLHCFEAATGKTVWAKDLRAEFGGSVIGWQNAASPLIEGDLLFVNVNATPNRLVALRLNDGSVAWRKHDEAMTHSTPVAATIEGVRQVIFLTQSGLVSVRPENGDQLWRHTPIPYNTSIAITPVVESNRVYYAGAYSMGSAAARIVKNGNALAAQQLMARRSSRMIHWSTPVAVNGFVYGLFGSQSGQLRSVDLQNNGEYGWQGPEFGTGATLLVDGKILVAAEDGQIVLVEPDPTEYREITRFQATNGRIWNSPGISDGILYVRATSELAAYDISLPLPPALKLTAAFDFLSGKLAITVATVNGTPIDAQRANGLRVLEATTLSIPLEAWDVSPLQFSLDAGVLRAEVDVPASSPGRYYATGEAQN